jgi:hypothetical protein
MKNLVNVSKVAVFSILFFGVFFTILMAANAKTTRMVGISSFDQKISECFFRTDPNCIIEDFNGKVDS